MPSGLTVRKDSRCSINLSARRETQRYYGVKVQNSLRSYRMCAARIIHATAVKIVLYVVCAHPDAAVAKH